MVSIRKFRIIVLVSNWIEYWNNYSIQNFEYSHSTTSVRLPNLVEIYETTAELLQVDNFQYSTVDHDHERWPWPWTLTVTMNLDHDHEPWLWPWTLTMNLDHSKVNIWCRCWTFMPNDMKNLTSTCSPDFPCLQTNNKQTNKLNNKHDRSQHLPEDVIIYKTANKGLNWPSVDECQRTSVHLSCVLMYQNHQEGRELSLETTQHTTHCYVTPSMLTATLQHEQHAVDL